MPALSWPDGKAGSKPERFPRRESWKMLRGVGMLACGGLGVYGGGACGRLGAWGSGVWGLEPR